MPPTLCLICFIFIFIRHRLALQKALGSLSQNIHASTGTDGLRIIIL